jgi:hypothetical protein
MSPTYHAEASIVTSRRRHPTFRFTQHRYTALHHVRRYRTAEEGEVRAKTTSHTEPTEG